MSVAALLLRRATLRATRCFSSDAKAITKLSVIGSGLMGTGIAQVFRIIHDAR